MNMTCNSIRPFALIFCLTILVSGCSTNNFCETDDDLKNVTRVSGVAAIEIVDDQKIHVTKEAGAPVQFFDEKGNTIESDILGLSDSIVLNDEHYGAGFKIIEITRETVSFAVDEAWSYPVSGWCNPGQRSGTIKIRPYNTQ